MHAHAIGQVRVQINQTRQQRCVAQIDNFRVRRNVKVVANLSDLLPLNAHHCRRNWFAATSIHQSPRFDDNGFRVEWSNEPERDNQTNLPNE